MSVSNRQKCLFYYIGILDFLQKSIPFVLSLSKGARRKRSPPFDRLRANGMTGQKRRMQEVYYFLRVLRSVKS